MDSFKKKTCILLIFFILCPICFFGCGKKQENISQSDFYFDTVITITLYDEKYRDFLNHCFSLADTYEGYFSATKADSDISKINLANGAAVKVHKETIELIEKGLYYSKLSQGGFDITIGAVSSLWDFQSETPALPDEAALKKAVSAVGYENVIISGDTAALKNPDARIDLGGIAKGYIADKMKAYLEENGVKEGIINLGGNVLCLGAKSDGQPYRIGVQKPFDKEGTVLFAVDVTDKTVVTSGVYERYFILDEKQYHHILNPKTGYPYENGLASVTIICDDSVDADALSTACFSMGLEKGMEFIENLPDTEAVFITEDLMPHFSSGMGSEIPYEMY